MKKIKFDLETEVTKNMAIVIFLCSLFIFWPIIFFSVIYFILSVVKIRIFLSILLLLFIVIVSCLFYIISNASMKVVYSKEKISFRDFFHIINVYEILKSKYLLYKDKVIDSNFVISSNYTEVEVLNNIFKSDEFFSNSDFKVFAGDLFFLLQSGKYENLKYFLSDSLYKNIMSSSLNIKSFLDVRIILKGFVVYDSKEKIIILIENKLGEISNNKCIMIFSRNRGLKSKLENVSSINYCRCGSKINILENSVCDNCKRDITINDFDWILDDIKVINK